MMTSIFNDLDAQMRWHNNAIMRVALKTLLKYMWPGHISVCLNRNNFGVLRIQEFLDDRSI